MPKWLEVLKHAKELGVEIQDARKVLETFALWGAVLEAHEKWPEIKDEFNAIRRAIADIVEDIR